MSLSTLPKIPEQRPLMNIDISMLRLTPSRGLKSQILSSPEELSLAKPIPIALPPAPKPKPKRYTSLSVRSVGRNSLSLRRRANSWSNIMADQVNPVPPALTQGVPMLKISSKKMKQVIMRLQDGCITWAGSSNSKIPINQIRELRLGQPPNDAALTSSRWITIVYVRGKEWKILHMISLTDDVHNHWVGTLRTLVSETSDRAVAEIKPSDPDLIWIRQLWPAGSKAIDMTTALGLCRSIGLEVPVQLQANYKDYLDMSDFRQLIKEAQTRPELETLYARLTSAGPLDRNRVERFLSETQQIKPTDLFNRYAKEDLWSLDSLADFLASPDNVPERAMDMTRPLPEYFISSSHNTYLVGEQWRGESTVEGYIRVLLAGCRCVELDIHDGDFEPEVFHKLTLTSKVTVREVCKAIDKYAFVSSPYPVILSVEIHCNLAQQNMVARAMRDTFGDKLVTEKMEDDGHELPSPEELKYRVLFKTKPKVTSAPSTPSKLQPDDRSAMSTSDTESDSALTKIVRRISFGGSSDSSASSAGQPKKAFSDELKCLLVYTAGVKYNGFSKLNKYEPHQQFSVSDRTAERIIKENKADWIKHNFSHLTRIYPKGARLNSSNYDPRPVWTAGNQLVALNWQTIDQGTILNHALFADTQGYVLKPLALRQKISEMPVSARIRIEIISAQRLPLSSDLYVEGQIDEHEQETKVVKGTSMAPAWNETFDWTVTSVPSLLDLTFVRLEIKSKANGLLAQWVRPISAAPKGYHYLPLYDPLFSKYVFATLFVRITVDAIPTGKV